MANRNPPVEIASGYVVGTAGHVDHGKSALVSALTGIHPDRLKEEQERQLSIDLGFAWLTLPGGTQVGFIDVPGHSDFIENMLAGVGGIDAALFVIAADEGVMPQTREHLAILDLLEVGAGVVALSKVDLVEDRRWLDLVEQEVRELMKGSSLENARVCRISSTTGEGLEPLRVTLSDLVDRREPAHDPAMTRLPIDRSFSISGFGTVVTGTLLGGDLQVGEVVEILPSGHRARVRGLQTHSKEVKRALARTRVAANLSGISPDEVQRGDLLAVPGSFLPTDLIDVQCRMLPGASGRLKHNQDLKIFVGPAERMARVRMLSGSSIEPGQSGVLQLLLNEPVATFIGERFIFRRPSPAETAGGGVVLDPHPVRRHKLGRKPVIDHLASLASEDQEAVLAAWLSGRPPLSSSWISRLTGWKASLVGELLDHLAVRGVLRALGDDDGLAGEKLYLTTRSWGTLVERVTEMLNSYHLSHPLEAGMSKAELRERLGVDQRVLDESVTIGTSEGWLGAEGALVRLPEFSIELNEAQSDSRAALLARFEQKPFEPPAAAEARAEVGEELYSLMKDQGDLIEVSSEVVFRREDHEYAVRRVLEMIKHSGEVTVAEVRDDLRSTRKYVMALLESLDAAGVTARVGDSRREGPRAASLEGSDLPLPSNENSDR